jgi:hypothetical protein
MKKSPFGLAVFVLLSFVTMELHGATLYVSLNSPNPIPPYSDWTTAATNIQDAIEASSPGDTVIVTNGVYNAGVTATPGNMSNRIVLDRAITVQSVNGPFSTVIQGGGATNGPNAIRCAWVTNGAALVGFTLTAGATQTSGNILTNQSGGGVWCASSNNATVTDCVIVSNTESYQGSGAFQGTLNNCYLSRNTAAHSSAVIFQAILNNCTVVSNTFNPTVNCLVTNSIVYYNSLGSIFSTFAYSCVSGGAPGTGNIPSAPQFLSDSIHLAGTSPCIGAGTTPVTSTDIFGNPWANPPSMGCAEEATKPSVAQPQVQVTAFPGFAITSTSITGVTPFTFNWLKDGAQLQDNGHFSSTQSSNLVASGVTLADAGGYQLVVSNSLGVVTSAVAQVVVHCVDVAAASPVAPYTNWATAAVQIQDALDAAGPGDIVLVTNGVYNTGGRAVSGTLTNRVALTNPVAVIGVNGYASTVIEGQWDPVSITGPAAVRCAWLTNGAVLSGFILRNGATLNNSFIQDGYYGGGAWLSSNAVVCNCVITNNQAYFNGGGVAFGTVNNSLIIGNAFTGVPSPIGGGGGAYGAVLNNCTVLGNRGSAYSSTSVGGIQSCTARNCIVLGNLTFYSQEANSANSTFLYSCTDPLPSGMGNIDTNPAFVDSSGHLPAVSSVRGAGSALYSTGTDLDDQPWASPPSMGCSELVLSNLVGPLTVAIKPPVFELFANHFSTLVGTVTGHIESLSWSYGDGTTVTNAGFAPAHKWTNAGTYLVTLTAYNLDNPSGVSSNLLVVVDPVNSPLLSVAGVVSNAFQFSFPGQTNLFYTVQFTTNLTPPISWQTLQTVFSTGGVFTIQDSSITNTAQFYRVQTQ